MKSNKYPDQHPTWSAASSWDIFFLKAASSSHRQLHNLPEVASFRCLQHTSLPLYQSRAHFGRVKTSPLQLQPYTGIVQEILPCSVCSSEGRTVYSLLPFPSPHTISTCCCVWLGWAFLPCNKVWVWAGTVMVNLRHWPLHISFQN